MTPFAYQFVPIYKERIWGGRAFERLFGRKLPDNVPIGESWELADLPEGESVVAEGPLEGRPMPEVIRQLGGHLLGKTSLTPEGRFPLLLKYLDANDTLSLQVHPDPSVAKSMGPTVNHKTECWYVLESRGGYILKGIKPGVKREDFQKALEQDDQATLSALVERYDVQAGDFHFLPAGTVHALGKGVVVAEVQTPSDTTFRVSDWGRGREVHVAEAMASIHFTPTPAAPPGATGTAKDPSAMLVSCPYFTVIRHRRDAGASKWPGGRCAAWMVISGTGELSSRAGDWRVAVTAGQTLLLPADLTDFTLDASREMTWLEVQVAGSR